MEDKKVYEGVVEVMGGSYPEMRETYIYLGDDEIVETLKVKKGKKIRITIEEIE